MMEYSNFYFVGSNIFHSGNIEASLKFKELSGIHAEAIYTTEIKHGPLAVAGDSIFIFVSSKNNNYKVLETINQVKSHGGKVLTLNDTDGDFLIPTSHHIFVDSISAIVYLQIIACKLGLKKGRNIDKPANLAKCVTI
jgi:glucosamine--fructose-6-phosphate aminotransferase (isomerizing)